MKKYILNPISLFIIGGILGVMSKYLDIYDTVQYYGFTFGEMFSELSIWILFGVLISIFSETKKKAMINILPFCLGMLLTYYIVAEIEDAIYGWNFIKGWLIFSLFSPLMAYFTWMTKEKGILPKIISVGIILVTSITSIILFGGPSWYDLVIVIILIYLLFIKKVKRKSSNSSNTSC